MYLVDTNILSTGAPTKAQPVVALLEWMDQHSSRLYLSVLTVAAIGDGIAKARRQGAIRKAERLDAWLETLLHLYSPRILPLDIEVARRVGQLSDQARAAGGGPGFPDLAIAATALVHDHIVLTRNLRHFRQLEVRAQDPLTTLPA